MEGETVNLITQMVGSLGFPIVACSALFWMYNKTIKGLQESVEELKDTVNRLIDKIEIKAKDN